MESLASSPWLLVTVIGVIALGAAIAYGMWRNSHRTAAERRLTEAATHAEYKREDV
jgi:hypothetical protein